MNAQKEQFVEKMGLLSEADGIPRIAGRIFGFLMLTPGECSLDDLAEELQVSRASVSNDARRLAQLGLIERRSRPGDRRDYYRSAPDAFRHSIERRIEGLRRFHAVIDEARVRGVPDPEVEHRLAEWDDAHRLMLESLKTLLTTLDAREAVK
jgi:DNA-binding transcriptional regulator GbsR (MarR family)